MMLKTALLISGHRRSIKHTAPNILAMATRLGADIFIHTWYDAEMQAATWRQPGCYDGVGEVHDDLAILGAKSVWVEDPAEATAILANQFPAGSTVHGSCFMVYGMKQALACLTAYEATHGERYDILLRYRFDLQVQQAECLQLALAEVSEGTVLMAEHNWLSCAGVWFDGVLLATADDYRRIIHALDHHYTRYYGQSLASGMVPLPEQMITRIIQAQQLTIRPLAASFGLVRANGVVEQYFRLSPCPWWRDVRSLSILLARVAANGPAEKVILQQLQAQGLPVTLRYAAYARHAIKRLLSGARRAIWQVR